MENLYEVLQIATDATTEEIRKAYIKLAKLYHPDKNTKSIEACENHCDSSDDIAKINGNHMFVKINHAWKVLSNPALRAEFDVKWTERCLHQKFPIQDNVAFSDFEFDEQDRLFVYPCRCGSDYILSETDAELYYDIVCCETCSLTIQVKYEEV